MAKHVGNLAISRQYGSARTMVATWTFGESHLDHFSITWKYKLADQKWYVGSSTTTKDKTASWTAPDNAVAAYVAVTPVSGKNKNKSYWSGEYKSVSTTDLLAKAPKITTPSAPGIQESNQTMIVSISGYSETADRTTTVRFEIYEYSTYGANGSLMHTLDAGIRGGSAVVQFTGNIGKVYSARAMGLAASGDGNFNSDWSGYAAQVQCQGPTGTPASNYQEVATPSTPSVSSVGKTITASVDNYNDSRVRQIQIQIMINGGATYDYPRDVINNHATLELGPSAGIDYNNRYKFRAIALSAVPGISNSQWSSWSADVIPTQNRYAAPPTPTLSLSGTTLTVRVDNYQDAAKASTIRFEIVMDDRTTVHAADQAISGGSAIITYTISAGHNYKARAKALGQGEESTWSGYSGNTSTVSSVPSVPEFSFSGSTGTIRVSNYTDAKANRIQFEIVQNNSTVIASPEVSISNQSASTTIQMEVGKEYKARARAGKNGDAKGLWSSWSNYSNNQTIYPDTPPAPTTSIDADTMTFEARIDNYLDTRTNQIKFEIIRDDATVVKTQTVNITYGAARVTYSPVIVNRNYKARAQAVGAKSDAWSSYSANIKLAAKKPDKPSDKPTVTITYRTLVASVDNYNDTLVDELYFQVIRDNSPSVFRAGKARVVTGRAAFTVNNIPIGSEYKARCYAIGVRGVSAGLNSDWTNYSDPKRTIPENVSKVTNICAMSSTSIKLEWPKAKAADSYRIQYTFNHEGYVIDDDFFDTGVDVTDVSDIKALFYPAVNLDMGKTYYFRVKAVNETGESEKWTKIVSCVIGTTPDAPSTWTYTTVGIIGDPIVMNWTHNTQDSADQTGARVYIKIVGQDGTVKRAESIYTTIDGKTQTYSFDTANLDDSDTVYWRVSTRGTKGISVEWGELSVARAVTVYTRPTLSIEAGSAGEGEIPIIESFPINIVMTAQPATQTAIAFYVSIVANDQYDVSGADGVEIHVSPGETIYQKYIEAVSNQTTLVLNPGDLYLVRDIEYTIKATVTMSNGLDADAETDILAEWETSLWDPDAEVNIDRDTATALIRPYCIDENGIEYKTGFTLAVYRIDYNGEFELIQERIDASATNTVLDLHPSLDYARYRICATDIYTGLVSYNDVIPPEMGIKGIIIQWGGSWEKFNLDYDYLNNFANEWTGTFLELPYNVDISDDISPDVAMINYIGRKHPVSYYGTQQGLTSSWKAEIKKNDEETLRKIRALSIYRGDVYVREPSGSGYWANVKVSYSITHDSKVIPVTFNVTRVEGGA